MREERPKHLALCLFTSIVNLVSNGHSAIQRSIVHRTIRFSTGFVRIEELDRTGKERKEHDRTGPERRLFAATELPVTMLLSAVSSFFLRGEEWPLQGSGMWEGN
jgi:hypothetical protein